jgi:hypothetical protein
MVARSVNHPVLTVAEDPVADLTVALLAAQLLSAKAEHIPPNTYDVLSATFVRL